MKSSHYYCWMEFVWSAVKATEPRSGPNNQTKKALKGSQSAKKWSLKPSTDKTQIRNLICVHLYRICIFAHFLKACKYRITGRWLDRKQMQVWLWRQNSEGSECSDRHLEVLHWQWNEKPPLPSCCDVLKGLTACCYHYCYFYLFLKLILQPPPVSPCLLLLLC